MNALLGDIRHALRLFVKNTGYTLVVLMTLAIAIGANTAVFSAVHHVLLRPLPYAEPDRLVMVVETQPEVERLPVPYLNYVDYRAQSSAFTALTAAGLHIMILDGRSDAETVLAQMVSHDFFSMLGVTPMLGRDFLPEEDAPNGPKVVILSHGLWSRRYAADPTIVGRSITIEGAEWTVVGVMPPDYRAFFYPISLTIPIGVRADEAMFRDRATRPEMYMFGRMKPGVTHAQASADMQAVGEELARRFPEQVGSSRPLVLPLHEELVRNVRVLLLLLLAAVGCVLLIAAANVANLTLERAMARQRELGIRAALGASRWRLVRQMLVESSLLALAGGALGLLLTLWSVDLMTAYSPDGAVTNALGPIEVDTAVLVYTTLVALGTGLLFGIVPALFATEQNLAQVLKSADGRATAGGRDLRARNLLVIIEVALALMLAIAASLAIRSLSTLTRADRGFVADGVLVFLIKPDPVRYPTAAAVVQFWNEVERNVAAIPGVASVTTTSGLPGLVGAYENFYPAGASRRPENAHIALTYRVDPGFNETLRIPLLAGRTCGRQDGPGTVPVVVIDKNLADKFFPGQNPVGQRLQDDRSKQPSLEIVGVVGHVMHDAVDVPEQTPYQMQYCFPQLSLEAQQDNAVGTTMHVLMRTEGSPDLSEQVKAAVAAVDPAIPISGIMSLEDSVQALLKPRQFTATLLGIFALIALLLAAIGLYAVIANSVARRTHELGVRLALGAQPRAIVALVVRQGMTLLAVGLVVGLLGALVLTDMTTTLRTDGVGAVDPITYLGTTVLLVTVGLLATYLPARRTTRIDPMIAMRHE